MSTDGECKTDDVRAGSQQGPNLLPQRVPVGSLPLPPKPKASPAQQTVSVGLPPPPSVKQVPTEKLEALYNLDKDYDWSHSHMLAYAELREKFGESWFQDTTVSVNVGQKTYDDVTHIRFVTISDTHKKHRALSKSNMLPKGDVIIHAGDFTSIGGIKEVKDFCDWFGSLPYKYKIVIAGNHDLSLDKGWYEIDQNWKSLGLPKIATSCSGEAIEIMRSCKKIIYLEESEVEVEGYKIFGSPYQPEFCNWAFNLERGEKCDERWNNIPTDTDILITHGPPLGHGDRCKHGHRAGCFDLLRHVQNRIKPKYHVFGHIHEGYGTSTNGATTFINASTCNYQYRPLQLPIVFDLPRKKEVR